MRLKRFDTQEQDNESLTGLTEQTPMYNTTDPECTKIHKSNKTTAGYNVQMVVEGKHGLIVHAESTNSPNDAGQLNDQIQKAKSVLNQTPEYVASDTGYYSLKDLASVDPTTTVVIPPQKQVLKERHKDAPTPLAKEQFTYDERSDQYICPEGQKLNRVGFDKNKQAYVYRAHQDTCLSCAHYGTCTTSSNGRIIKRSIPERLKEH